MLINELPDDCLLAVFDYLDYLDDLVNCYKVCIKWSHLIAQRTKKVKYLLGGNPKNGNCVFYQGTEPIDGTCLSTLFPNLKIAEISYKFGGKVKREDIVALLKNQKSLKGLTGRYHEALSEYCDNLEMVSFDLFNSTSQHNGSSIKQLYGCTSIDRFQKDVHYFPNLERLNVHCDYEYDLYNGPVLEKLKILELFSPYPHGICYALKFMDSCPNLQSAYILLNDNPLFVDETIRLECLQDLVIDYIIVNKFRLLQHGRVCSDQNNWNDLKRLLMKYPNLKHLALRNLRGIEDELIKQFAHILPNLVLLYVRNCYGVTERAADYVQSHCKRYGRSIKFYFEGNYHEIGTDWPQLSTKREKISRGFDFMKHCFLKHFDNLPHFLVPLDY